MDEAWEMFEWLVGDTCKFEEVVLASKMSFLDPCTFHARSYYEEQFAESCASFSHLLNYALPFYDSFQ